MRQYLLLLLSLLLVTGVAAQTRRYTVSGNITDGSTGEDLIGASAYVEALQIGTASNTYGFYSLTLPSGQQRLSFSFVGYQTFELTLDLQKNEKLNVKLTPVTNELEEVVVRSNGRNANVTRSEMSVERLSVAELKRIPALMGEVDVIKALQLLPGVQSTSEASSGFSVRGGSPDQNLIILDEATVYNASHLMGFFSVFNNDAIKDVVLYKGDIPATFGGRLSSLLDVRIRDGNNQRFTATGGIGTISSRLTVEGPIIPNKLTYLVSGRRTYADVFLLLSGEKDLRNSRLYFYDLNGKVNYRLNDNNRVFVAAYLGRDKFANRLAGMNFGNQTLTLRWNHVFTPKLFSNFTAIGSFYDYYLSAEITEQLSLEWLSKMQDFGFKADFSWHINPNNSIKYGYNLMFHNFAPGEGGGTGSQSIITRFEEPWQHALEHALFVSFETKIWSKLTLKYGLRYALFQNIGNGEQTYTLDNYAVVDSATYSNGKSYHTYGRFEPRLGLLYTINSANSIKASYARTSQFIQLASNSASGSPLDVWFQSSPNVKPQICDQFAVGYFRNFLDNKFETSVEVYYKNLKHVIDFKDHAALMGNANLEQELRFGVGYAYGLELMIRKNEGRFSGWVSYTYARAKRRIDMVNDGNWFRSPYDKPNNISIVLNYDLNARWNVSANWVYATGMPVTFPTGRFEIEGRYVPIYAKRNESRYPDYHRLDVSATWKLRTRPSRRVKSELNFSVYNAYGRHNPWTIFFRQEEDNPNQSYAEMLYLFSFVPSITWNFTF